MAEKRLPKKNAAAKQTAAKKTTRKKATTKKQAATTNPAPASVQHVAATVRVLFIEDTTGEQFTCQVPVGTLINQLASDFFEDRGWDTQDKRAVVELVDGENRDRTRRLRGDLTVEEEGLQDGDILRVFPESIAGVLNEITRLPALIQDLNGMCELAEWNPRITFEAKPENAPTWYLVKLDYPGFRRLEGNKPIQTTAPHEVEIHLGADYPRQAPLVLWKTEIFHPNIHPDHRGVCLGVLMQYWLPGFGIPRLVIMLAEIAQWRNFDIIHGRNLNPEAALWADDPQNMQYVLDIGGSPDQHPIGEWLKRLEKETQQRQPLVFNRVNRKHCS